MTIDSVLLDAAIAMLEAARDVPSDPGALRWCADEYKRCHPPPRCGAIPCRPAPSGDPAS